MTVTVRVQDRITRVAPFGARFWDAPSARVVGDGLQVLLYPADQPWRRVYAKPNRSAVYVLHDGPGLGRAARGKGDDEYWRNLPETRDYRCEVTDSLARFHPFSFSARLPAQGVFVPATSPPATVPGIELFSTPTRALPGALAVIRAELASAATGGPAAWALLTAEYGGRELGRGIADPKGKIVLAFGYPEPERRSRTSPPQSFSPPVHDGILMQWEVRLRVFHSPMLAAHAMPDYRALLEQPKARLLEGLSPLHEFETATVMLGCETVYPLPKRSPLYVAPA